MLYYTFLVRGDVGRIAVLSVLSEASLMMWCGTVLLVVWYGLQLQPYLARLPWTPGLVPVLRRLVYAAGKGLCACAWCGQVGGGGERTR